jgi:hypothetical protein
MRNKKTNIILIIVVAVITLWVLKDTFTQTSASDLKGGFTEIASYRNENNTGPIQRIYAVTVKDTTNAQLEDYGNLMPHSKYGNTKVYFFLAGSQTPKELTPGDTNFDAVYQKGCFALYEKSAMGNYGLIKNPFN